MGKTVLYCRTANSGAVGKESQLEAVRRYAEGMGCHQATAYCDWGRGGTTLERPCLQKLLADICTGEIGRVVVHNLPRLSRDTAQLHELASVFRQYGVEVFSMRDGGVVDFARLEWLLTEWVGW